MAIGLGTRPKEITDNRLQITVRPDKSNKAHLKELVAVVALFYYRFTKHQVMGRFASAAVVSEMSRNDRGWIYGRKVVLM